MEATQLRQKNIKAEAPGVRSYRAFRKRNPKKPQGSEMWMVNWQVDISPAARFLVGILGLEPAFKTKGELPTTQPN